MPDHYDPDSYEEGGYPLPFDGSYEDREIEYPQAPKAEETPEDGCFQLMFAMLMIAVLLVAISASLQSRGG